MGSDSDSSSVKTIAPSDGLKLHVSHSLTVSMSTAIVVSACNSKSEDAREAKVSTANSRRWLPDHAAAFPACGPTTLDAPAEIWGTADIINSILP